MPLSSYEQVLELHPSELIARLMPPRSRLYHLEPIGVGTPYVECLTGSAQNAGIAFVKPLRGRATLSRRWSTSLQAQLEHPPGIRLGAGTRFFLMHLVTLLYATSVSQAGARNE